MTNKTIGLQLYDYFSKLDFSSTLPTGFEVMNPFRSEEVLQINKLFYTRFYNDSHPRTLIMGINPGRFGAGVTGISFTDPVKLDRELGIENNLQKKPELSADFIYAVIRAFGGPEKFFSRYLLSALSPLGFTLNGLNANFYDTSELRAAIRDFILQSVKKQQNITQSNDRCIILGSGKNMDFFGPLNEEYKLFENVQVLKHPRWIMQYRRKSVDEYVQEYIKILSV